VRFPLAATSKPSDWQADELENLRELFAFLKGSLKLAILDYTSLFETNVLSSVSVHRSRVDHAALLSHSNCRQLLGGVLK
jgi:hypothetical protein